MQRINALGGILLSIHYQFDLCQYSTQMNGLMRTLAVMAFALPLSSHVLSAEIFPAQVVGVVDGDTLRVFRDGKRVKVRLYGIDCPEKSQKYGKEARQLAHRLAYGRMVFVENHGKDRYGRIIGSMTLPTGNLLSRELVGADACWWYRRPPG